MPKLVEINLQFNLINDISVMAEWKCPNLKKVLYYDGIVDKIPCLDMLNLEEVNLSRNKIKEISALRSWKCPSLKALNL